MGYPNNRPNHERVPSHDPEYRRLLKRLRQARLDAGLSQQQVAERLRKPQSYVSKCESGERRIDPIELKGFASMYGADILVLLDLK